MKSSEVCIRTESTLAKRLFLLKGQVVKYTIVAFGLQVYFRTTTTKKTNAILIRQLAYTIRTRRLAGYEKFCLDDGL